MVYEYLRQGLDEEPFYTNREYLGAIKRVGQIKNQLDRIERWVEGEQNIVSPTVSMSEKLHRPMADLKPSVLSSCF